MKLEPLLEMIKNADPEDQELMDKIDVLVECYRQDWNYSPAHLEDYQKSKKNDPEYFKRHYKEYTRSRDALKKLRPKNWHICGHYALATALGYSFSLFQIKAGGKQVIGGGMIKSEELAELSAILLALEQNKNDEVIRRSGT